jgi:hypothetical protein
MDAGRPLPPVAAAPLPPPAAGHAVRRDRAPLPGPLPRPTNQPSRRADGSAHSGGPEGTSGPPPGRSETPPSHHKASLAHSFFQLDWGSGNLLLRSQPFEKVLGLLKEKDIPPELSHTNPTPNPAAKYLTSVQIDAKIPSS